jgi:hypothetical protein
MQRPELKWKSDLLGSFRSIDKAVNEQPILVVSYLVMAVLSGLLPPFEVAEKLVGQAFLLCIASIVARKAWHGQLEEEEAKAFAIQRGGTQALTLIFLQVLFYLPIFVPLVFLMFAADFIRGPLSVLLALVWIVFACWWSVKSSLALVIVAVEDCGAIPALLDSHRQLNGKFWSTVRYLLPVVLSLALPLALFFSLTKYGYRVVLEQAVGLPIAIGANAVKSLLESATYFAAQLILTACLTRLYASLKNFGDGSDAKIQV